MEKEITKKYSNGEVTIIWKPHLCIHSGICAKGLPNIFKPQERPWIQPDAAATQQIVEQVARCPSKALTTDLGSNASDEQAKSLVTDDRTIKVEMVQNGPLVIHGDLEITTADGSTIVKKGTAVMCRCGASEHKPYCDGSHQKNGFEG